VNIAILLSAPPETLIPVGWVREHLLPEPPAELVAYRLAVATAGAFYAAVARGDIPQALCKRGAAAHTGVTVEETNPTPDMPQQFSKSLGERGARVRVWTRPNTSVYYMDYTDDNGERQRPAIRDPLTGIGVTNKQLALDIAMAFQLQRQADLLRIKMRTRLEELTEEGFGDFLPKAFATELPPEIKVYTESPGVRVEEDSDPSNIRMQAAWDQVGMLEPEKASKVARRGELADFTYAMRAALDHFGDVRLRDITQSDVHRYEAANASFASSTRRKRTHVYLRSVFDHFKFVVPSLRGLEIKKVSTKNGNGGRYSEAEMAKLEAAIPDCDDIHPDAGDMFTAMLANGWRINMARNVMGSGLHDAVETATGRPWLVVRADIRTVKATADVLAAIEAGETEWSFPVDDPKIIAMLKDRAARKGKGYLFSDKPKKARTYNWLNKQLKALEVCAGVRNVKGRSTHALKREFGTRSQGDPNRGVKSRTEITTIDGIYAEGGERAFRASLSNMGVEML